MTVIYAIRSFWATIVLLFIFAVISVVFAQTPMNPTTQAVGFDFPDARMDDVTRFEIKYDTGSFTSVQIPESFVGGLTTAGSKTYRVFPPFTSGTHSVSVRACNATGCGGASTPFTFVSAGSSPALPVPNNVRVVNR